MYDRMCRCGDSTALVCITECAGVEDYTAFVRMVGCAGVEDYTALVCMLVCACVGVTLHLYVC